MTSACFSRGHTGFSRNATLVATVNPPALAGGVFKVNLSPSLTNSNILFSVKKNKGAAAKTAAPFYEQRNLRFNEFEYTQGFCRPFGKSRIRFPTRSCLSSATRPTNSHRIDFFLDPVDSVYQQVL